MNRRVGVGSDPGAWPDVTLRAALDKLELGRELFVLDAAEMEALGRECLARAAAMRAEVFGVPMPGVPRAGVDTLAGRGDALTYGTLHQLEAATSRHLVAPAIVARQVRSLIRAARQRNRVQDVLEEMRLAPGADEHDEVWARIALALAVSKS